MNVHNIPDLLIQLALWCVWKMNSDRGKIPYNPHTGYKAKSNDPSTFSDFQTVCKAFETGSMTVWESVSFMVLVLLISITAL